MKTERTSLRPVRAASAVEQVTEDLAAGRMAVLIRDEDEESGADLILAGEFADAAAINFMAKEGRGLICIALSSERCTELGLEPIVRHGQTTLADSSLVPIEARTGVTTGISAADRARTIQVAVDPSSRSQDLVKPGHVFPLRAAPGGLREHPGRVEAAIALVDDAGLRPAAVLCQILGEDGQVADRSELNQLCRKHDLAQVAFSEVLAHRLVAEPDPVVADIRQVMRGVMGHFATGVAVVTASHGDGVVVGTTANAITSVSLDPPLLLACLATNSETLGAIRQAGRFAVNVLTADQRSHSDRFAKKGAGARSQEVEFEDHSLGVPVLPRALATVVCEVEAIHRAGDHDVVIGRARSLAHLEEAEPLLFYRGSYSRLMSVSDGDEGGA